MKTISLESAAALVPDGSTLMIGGFMGVGSPERLIDELLRQGRRDLTVIANDTATPGRGIAKLVAARALRKAVVSHIGLNPETQRAGGHQLRDAAARRGGVVGDHRQVAPALAQQLVDQALG